MWNGDQVKTKTDEPELTPNQPDDARAAQIPAEQKKETKRRKVDNRNIQQKKPVAVTAAKQPNVKEKIILIQKDFLYVK